MVASTDAADPRGSRPLDDASRLAVLKALGDDTRYSLYREIAMAGAPIATAEIAARMGLHVNTVRPHLERMREVGLLDVHSVASGGVGRPQHHYGLAADAPRLGLEPPAEPLVARLLLDMATSAGLDDEAALAAGRRQGRHDAGTHAGEPCPEALIAELDRLGFAPDVAVDSDGATTISFGNCPFRELAEAEPAMVCGLHRGMVEGFVAQLGGQVESFRTLESDERCQVEVCRDARP